VCLAISVYGLRHLHGELTRRNKDESGRSLPRRFSGGNALHQGKGERGGLAGAGRRLAEQVLALEERRNGFALDGRRLFVAERGERADQGLVQAERRETDRGFNRRLHVLSCACSGNLSCVLA
jgi:hypothetical protein